MKTGAGMVQDKRVDMGSMGDFNGVVGKNPGPRHQSHKDSAMDRSPYYDKVCTTSVPVHCCGWQCSHECVEHPLQRSPSAFVSF